MNRTNVGFANHDSVLEGCYHEMGHVLATLLFFPDDGRIKGISFSKLPNGRFQIYTSYNDYKWTLPSQLNALIMCCIGGGIFQQMKMLSRNYTKVYFCDLDRRVKCPYEGMEEDLEYLDHMYNLLVSHKKVTKVLDLDEEKKKAITLFMPFIDCQKIDELCEYITSKILTCSGASDTLIEMNVINSYLMDDSCAYYNYYNSPKNKS